MKKKNTQYLAANQHLAFGLVTPCAHQTESIWGPLASCIEACQLRLEIVVTEGRRVVQNSHSAISPFSIFDILVSIEHVSGVVPVPKRIRPFADESCSNLLNRLSHLVTNAVRPTHQHLVHNAELSLRGAVKKNTGSFSRIEKHNGILI